MKVKARFFFVLMVLAIMALAPTAHAASDWGGAYAGINGTYTTSGSLHAWRDGSGQPDIKPTGPVFGIQAGYQRELENHIVLGAETDYQFMSVDGDGDTTLVCPAATCGVDVTERDSVTIHDVGTVRARLGMALGRYLPYVTAGYAYGSADATARFNVLPAVTNKVHADGWVAGGGVEYRLGEDWSLRGEYAHLKLADGDMHFRANIVRFGLNYRFFGQ